MKHSIIFSAIMTVVLAGVTSGQPVSKLRLSFSEEIAGSGVPTGGTVVFTGLENPDMRVYEAIIPATTFLSSVPFFWLGLIFIAVFTGPDSFLPAANGYDPGLVPHWDSTFITSALVHTILPALTIVVTSVSGWRRSTAPASTIASREPRSRVVSSTSGRWPARSLRSKAAAR